MIAPAFQFQLSDFSFPPLCGCADPQRCHRSVAAAFLAERLGAEVAHIFAPVRPAQLDDRLRLPGID